MQTAWVTVRKGRIFWIRYLSSVIITMISYWLSVQIPRLQLNNIHLAWRILRTHCIERAVIAIHKWCETHFVVSRANNIDLVDIIHYATSLNMTWSPINELTVWYDLKLCVTSYYLNAGRAFITSHSSALLDWLTIDLRVMTLHACCLMQSLVAYTALISWY